MVHITPDFLGAEQADFQLGIVHGGAVTAGRAGDAEASAGEKGEGRFLQAATGQTEFELAGSVWHKSEGRKMGP